MKIWYPKRYDNSKTDNVNDYKRECGLGLQAFKAILRNNINSPRWGLLKQKLLTSKYIMVNNQNAFNPVSIPNQYIAYLQCYYDYAENRCYYEVPDTVRCVGTTTSLNDVVKLIEYGNDTIPPMNWIRYSYLKFNYIIMGDDK